MNKSREAFEKWYSDNFADNFISIEAQLEKRGEDYIDFHAHDTWGAWQEQQKRIDELQRRNHRLNDTIKQQGRKLVYQNEVIETQAEKLLGLRDGEAELQKQVDAALKETQHALRYVEADMRGNHEFLKMAMIRTFKSLAQTLKGGEV